MNRVSLKNKECNYAKYKSEKKQENSLTQSLQQKETNTEILSKTGINVKSQKKLMCGQV